MSSQPGDRFGAVEQSAPMMQTTLPSADPCRHDQGRNARDARLRQANPSDTTRHTQPNTPPWYAGLGRVTTAWLLGMMLVMAALGGTLRAAQAQIDTASSPEADIIRVTVPDQVIGINPLHTNTIGSASVVSALFVGLVTYDHHQGYVPALAESWTINDEATVYTFKLRDNQRWSDGTPLTLDTVMESFAILQTTPAAATIYDFSQADIEGFTTEAGSFIRFTLPQTTPLFLAYLNHSTAWILPVHLKDQIDFGQNWGPAEALGKLAYSGPYILADADETRLTLRPNPHFQLTQLRNDGIDLTILPDEDERTTINKIERNHTDLVIAPSAGQAPFIKELSGRGSITTRLLFAPSVEFLMFNHAAPPFNEADIRKAVTYALADPLPSTFLTANALSEARTLIPDTLAGVYDAVVPDWAQTQDHDTLLNEARSLMRAAGYSETSPLRIELRTNDALMTTRLAKLAESKLARIYVQADIVVEPWADHIAAVYVDRDFQLARTAWYFDYSHPLSFLELYHSASIYNPGAYNRPDFDALIEALRVTTDPDSINRLSRQAQQMLFESFALVPNGHERWLVMTRVDITFQDLTYFGHPEFYDLRRQSDQS